MPFQGGDREAKQLEARYVPVPRGRVVKSHDLLDRAAAEYDYDHYDQEQLVDLEHRGLRGDFIPPAPPAGPPEPPQPYTPPPGSPRDERLLPLKRVSPPLKKQAPPRPTRADGGRPPLLSVNEGETLGVQRNKISLRSLAAASKKIGRGGVGLRGRGGGGGGGAGAGVKGRSSI